MTLRERSGPYQLHLGSSIELAEGQVRSVVVGAKKTVRSAEFQAASSA